MATMMREENIVTDLDRGADVLYVARGEPRDDEGVDHDNGVVLRFGAVDDLPTGVTIVGFNAFGWHSKIQELAQIIGSHLSVSSDEVAESIGSAQRRANNADPR